MAFGSTHVARIGDVPERRSARPSRKVEFEIEFDVVVVGGGGAGLTATVFAAWLGNSVALLEKAAELGGTTIKSGFVTSIPNNGPMLETGEPEAEEDFVRFAARTSRPEKYDPQSPTYGQSEWEIERYRAFFRDAWPAMKQLHERGALRYGTTERYVDNWSNLPEDAVPRGRALSIDGGDLKHPNGGALGIASLAAAAREAGVDIRTGHRVQRVIVDPDGAVVGVVATTADGRDVRIGARKGVIFCSGGFSHDRELRENFLSVPILHAGAALTNEGDFIRIAGPVGAQLRNMQGAWYSLVNLEGALRADPGFRNSFITSGDSMIFVNYRGKRFMNEKIAYAESGPAMNQWDPTLCEHPNRVVISIWDQHNQDNSAGDYHGNSVVPEGDDDGHVIKADTLAELAQGIGDRLEKHRTHTGGVRLDEHFLSNLEQTISRWNEMAEAGVDDDFHRGAREVERTVYAGRVAREPDKKNPVMWPISGTGPYYATLLMAGALDTKGGPKTNSWGQLLDDRDQPIPGLYGVGNCIANTHSYWGPGATLGPIVAFGYRAAHAVDRESRRTLSGS